MSDKSKHEINKIPPHILPGCNVGHNKRYNDFNTYLKRYFGVKVHKITIDAGMSCPNRDGSISDAGCIYCNERGSGTGAWEGGISIQQQIIHAKDYLKNRFKAQKFLAYFQSFTNTYAPIERLKGIYEEALAVEDIVGICIGTRPDCVSEECLKMIQGFTMDYMVWIEYGLQSFQDHILNRINRGHTVNQFLDAIRLTKNRGINTCVHMILGLPGETKKEMIEGAKRLSMLDIQGVKIHLLYIIKDTPMAGLFKRGEYTCLTQEEYIDTLVNFLGNLREDIIVQRLTSDPHPEELIAPLWSLNKAEILSEIMKKMHREDIWQGKCLTKISQAQTRSVMGK